MPFSFFFLKILSFSGVCEPVDSAICQQKNNLEVCKNTKFVCDLRDTTGEIILTGVVSVTQIPVHP